MSIPLLVRICIETNDDKGIMKILRREGSKESELYVQVLTYFVQRSLSVADGEFISLSDEGSDTMAVMAT